MLFNPDDRSNFYPCTMPLMADALGVAYHRIYYIVRSRNIESMGRLGRARIFSIEAFDEVCRHFRLINARKRTSATGRAPQWVPGFQGMDRPYGEAG